MYAYYYIYKREMKNVYSGNSQKNIFILEFSPFGHYFYSL
jgi:hypothetical protein